MDYRCYRIEFDQELVRLAQRIVDIVKVDP